MRKNQDAVPQVYLGSILTTIYLRDLATCTKLLLESAIETAHRGDKAQAADIGRYVRMARIPQLLEGQPCPWNHHHDAGKVLSFYVGLVMRASHPDYSLNQFPSEPVPSFSLDERPGKTERVNGSSRVGQTQSLNNQRKEA